MPTIEISQQMDTVRGKFIKKPEIELKQQTMTVKLEEAMFWYCEEGNSLGLNQFDNGLQKKVAML